jgi:hypothetical protein
MIIAMKRSLVKYGVNIAVTGLVGLALIVGYMLGRAHEFGLYKGDVQVFNVPLYANISDANASNISAPVVNKSDVNKSSDTSQGDIVASKNGTKYYPKGCSGISRIKEENKIYFRTEAEAVASGLEKSVTCK